MLDVSVSYRRFAFLGHEFLTWLWYGAETESLPLPKDGAFLAVGNRIVLENRRKNSVEKISIKGDEADLTEGMLALKKGALVTEMSLSYTEGDEKWAFNLTGESLAVTGLKPPATGKAEKEEDLEGAILEKAALVETVVTLVDHLFGAFMTLRLDPAWERETLASVRNWIAGETA